MFEMGDYWNRVCDAQSKKEGWALFDADGVLHIQALDDPEPGQGWLEGRDNAAYSLCFKKALGGSKLHALALFLDGRPADEPVFIPAEVMK